VNEAFAALAVDTATDVCSLAIGRAGRRWSRDYDGVADRSRGVYGWIEALLDEAGIGLAALDAIAYGAGPGSFTGLRVASSVAQGLGRAAGLPVCAVSSLESLAVGAARQQGFAGTVAACLDARMDELYLGVYEVSADGSRALRPDALIAPQAIRLPEARPILLAGPGWGRYPDLPAHVAPARSAVSPQARPSGIAMLEIAARQFAAGRCTDAARAVPNYLRNRVTDASG